MFKRKEIKVSRLEEKVKHFNKLNTVHSYVVRKLKNDQRAANIYRVSLHERGMEHRLGRTVFEGSELQSIAFVMGMIEGWKETLNRHSR